MSFPKTSKKKKSDQNWIIFDKIPDGIYKAFWQYSILVTGYPPIVEEDRKFSLLLLYNLYSGLDTTYIPTEHIELFIEYWRLYEIEC